MNSNLSRLYREFTTRPREMTAWEMEYWIDGTSRKTGRGYYVPKGEVFCRALNQDGSLCEEMQRFETSTMLRHYRKRHAIEYHASAPRTYGKTREERERATKCFEEQVLQVLRANDINENGTWGELIDMIKSYELREKQLGSKKTTRIEQWNVASGANEENDPAVIRIRRPVAEVFSTVSEKNAKRDNSSTAMGKAIEMQTETHRIVSSHKRALSDAGREGIEKRARTEEKTSLSARGTIESNTQYYSGLE